MLKVVLINTTEGWLILKKGKGLVDKKAFSSVAAARKFLQFNWPGAEVVGVEEGEWS